jgi:hypothetical protein
MNPPDESYPLAWPVGWPRTPRARRASFGAWSLYKARSALQHELRLLGATSVVLSSNLPLRQDGLPYSSAREPSDHGAAVYFRIKGEPRVLACDRWDLVAHNFRALALHVGAIRGQLRWGVGSLEQAFGGYKALTAVGARRPWHDVLGVPATASPGEVEQRIRDLQRLHHPDRGGSHDQMAEINAAADDWRRTRAP